MWDDEEEGMRLSEVRHVVVEFDVASVDADDAAADVVRSADRWTLGFVTTSVNTL